MSQTEVTTRAPRGWVALSADTRHLVVCGPDSVADDLQGPLAAGLVEVLGALGRDGLDALPDFALVDTAGETVRVLVGGAGVVRADGSEIASQDRLPWRDVDVEAAVVEVVGGRGGWRRPTRLGRPAATAGIEAGGEAGEVGAAGGSGEGGADPVAESAPQADLTLPPTEEYSGVAPADRVLPEPEQPEHPKVEPEEQRKGLIESVPWRTVPDEDGGVSDPIEASGPPSAAEEQVPAGPDPSADQPGSADGPPATDDVADPQAGDPDGSATRRDEDAADAAVGATAPQVPDRTLERDSFAPPEPSAAEGPIVLAVICPAGHHSSPHASQCRVCGRDLASQQPFQTPRPPLGVLRISTGGLVPLDRGILLGRSPRVNDELPPAARPHLVRLVSRDNDISRNHAEIILEGWHVLVRDLGSTNGTTISLPGQEPVRLRPSEDFGIEPGAIITLADEVALTYEVSE